MVRRVALAALLFLPAVAFAQNISVMQFTGGKPNPVRNQIVSALCGAAECVPQAKVSAGGKPDWKKAKKEKVGFFVLGKIGGKPKKQSLELQVLSKQGKPPKLKKSFALQKDGTLSDKNLEAAAAALADAMGIELEAEEAAKPEEKPKPTAAQVEEKPKETPPAEEEEKPKKKKKKEEDPPPEEKPAPKEEQPDPEPVSPVEPAAKVHVPTFIAEVGLELFSRNFTYSQVTTMNLRSYSAPFIIAPVIRAEVYPLMFAGQKGLLSGIGLEAGVSFAVGLKSRKPGVDDITYPTSITRFDIALKWAIRPVADSEAYFAPFIGFRSHTFSPGKGADDSEIDGLPGTAYSSLKIGLAGELPFSNTGLLLFARFAVLPTFGSGPVISSTYFRGGSTFGIDGGLGLGFKIPPLPALQLRLGMDFMRYGLSFKTEPTDTYVAEGAVDQYFGGSLSVRYTY